MNSLSIGVSRRFLGAITSLYYSGNIIEDMFGYIQNNPGLGQVSIEAIEGLSGSDYELLGELNGKNNIDSRTTVNALFGVGSFGINLGYSQHLTGHVSADAGNPFPGSGQDGTINTGKNALLDNSIAPSLEIGLTFGGQKVIVRTTLAATLDIHSYRDFKQGSMVNLSNYFLPGSTSGTYTITDNVTEKELADYYEPAGLFRAEFEFPTDERSRAALAIEGGYRYRLYSNADDKGNTINGKYYSRKTGLQGERGFKYTTTEISDWGIIGRPSIRYISAVTNRLRVGLNGGVGLNMDFGKETSREYHYLNFLDYQDDDNPIYDNITTRLTDLSLAVNPLLGIGMVFEIVPGRFKVNAGAGAEQTLYRFSVGTETTNIGGNEVETPLFTQEWGKPEAQLGLGATFMFGRPEISESRYTLDAMFSSNGMDLSKSNFVVQFSARF